MFFLTNEIAVSSDCLSVCSSWMSRFLPNAGSRSNFLRLKSNGLSCCWGRCHDDLFKAVIVVLCGIGAMTGGSVELLAGVLWHVMSLREDGVEYL